MITDEYVFSREYSEDNPLDDKDLALKMIKTNPFLMHNLTDRLKQDKDINLSLVSFDNAYGLINIDPIFIDDKDFMLKAVKINSEALYYASMQLQNDQDIINAITKN